MTIKLQQEDVKEIINRLSEVFNKEKSNLNELDSKIGDGDHGLSMARGFNAIVSYLKDNPDLSISDILSQGGMQFNEVTGSTIGILIFSAMRAAGMKVKDKTEIGFPDLQTMLAVSIEAIQKRGKAQKGQKTILDTLIPTLKYLESQKIDEDESEIITEAINIAHKSAEATKDLEPQVGRARWFKERGMGNIDPGAYTGYLIIKTVGEYILKDISSKHN
jgi:phosphoenolpyruvate---glycerone phosphotransferase subunit DhaL